MYVFFVVIQNLLLVGRFPLGIVVDRFPEAGQIFVSLALGQLGHLGRDTRYFLESDLMDVSGRDVDGRHFFHGFGVARFPVSEAFDRKLGSVLWGRIRSAGTGRIFCTLVKHRR